MPYNRRNTHINKGVDMNKFMEYVGKNSDAINTLVGATATVAITAVYVTFGVGLYKAIKAESKKHAEIVVEDATEEVVIED
jgi:hypothetical protein